MTSPSTPVILSNSVQAHRALLETVHSEIHKRTPIERMVKFHELVKEKQFPNARSHSVRMEVGEDAIREDIEYMRSNLKLPLDYSRSKHGWFYMEKVSSFPTVHVSESEAIWLTMAQFAFESFPGLDSTGKMRSAVNKLSSATLDDFKMSQDQLRRLITFRPGRLMVQMDESILPKVWEGLVNSLELEFLYKKPEADAPSRRCVRPLTLLWVDGCFYLFGHDQGAESENKLRTFALPRMSELKLSRRHFERPLNFDLEKELANSFGIHTGGEVADVKIQFVGRAISHVIERIWHRSQTTTILQNGTLELGMRVAINPEFERWVLSWGGDARVIEPVSLREQVIAHAQRVIKQG